MAVLRNNWVVIGKFTRKRVQNSPNFGDAADSIRARFMAGFVQTPRFHF